MRGIVFPLLLILTSSVADLDQAKARADVYFPPPDSAGGWRVLTGADEIRLTCGMDLQKLDEAYDVARASTNNGGLLVVRNGWLVYERYFGLGGRDSTPNLGSIGKPFTSIAVGMLMAERPERFPDGLDQKVFNPTFLPSIAFPLADARLADVKLGQLLSFTAGLRGNNPGYVNGVETHLDPPGPDGWYAMLDEVAVGKRSIESNGRPTSVLPLWCRPGEGYSYATGSAHLASMILRHVSGMELEEYVRGRIAVPLGWGSFTYGYRHAKDVKHTPGGGGIVVRATDMLRFGYMLLRNGRWLDRQVAPAEYVCQCGRRSRFNPHSSYSLQFDVNDDGHIPEYPRDGYWKSGSGGHTLYIVPSLDLVVWRLGGRDSQYQPEDTGIPLKPSGAASSGSRAGWKPTIEEKAAQRIILRKVIEAIVER